MKALLFIMKFVIYANQQLSSDSCFKKLDK